MAPSRMLNCLALGSERYQVLHGVPCPFYKANQSTPGSFGHAKECLQHASCSSKAPAGANSAPTSCITSRPQIPQVYMGIYDIRGMGNCTKPRRLLSWDNKVVSKLMAYWHLVFVPTSSRCSQIFSGGANTTSQPTALHTRAKERPMMAAQVPENIDHPLPPLSTA